jgi:hypothetical protein
MIDKRALPIALRVNNCHSRPHSGSSRYTELNRYVLLAHACRFSTPLSI